MSSNRRILESMLSSESNASRNNTHSNHSNPVRARLVRLIELQKAQQNETLPFTLTAASSDSSIYEFASDAGHNLDTVKERGLLSDLGMQQIGANQCQELGDELYYNPECYPYFKSVFRTDNDDAKLHISTLLAMYACSANATALSNAQRASIDNYCKYNDESTMKVLRIFLPVSLGIMALLILAAVVITRRKMLQARHANSAVAPIVSEDPLRQGLLAEDQPNLTQSQAETQRTGRTFSS